MAHVTLSGTITVPQSCSINAGQVIEVRLPDIEGKDIRNLGDSPQNSHVTTQVNFTCSNVADGTNLSMSLNGETDPHNPEYLKTDNENLGIRISDKYDKTIIPAAAPNCRLKITQTVKAAPSSPPRRSIPPDMFPTPENTGYRHAGDSDSLREALGFSKPPTYSPVTH